SRTARSIISRASVSGPGVGGGVTVAPVAPRCQFGRRWLGWPPRRSLPSPDRAIRSVLYCPCGHAGKHQESQTLGVSLALWPFGSIRGSARLRSALLSDRLRLSEMKLTERAVGALRDIRWAQPLLRRLARAGGLSPDARAIMFEVRVALELHRAGV